MNDEAIPINPATPAITRIASTGHQLVCRINGGSNALPVSE
jgi:hypothetical protein